MLLCFICGFLFQSVIYQLAENNSDDETLWSVSVLDFDAINQNTPTATLLQKGGGVIVERHRQRIILNSPSHTRKKMRFLKTMG